MTQRLKRCRCGSPPPALSHHSPRGTFWYVCIANGCYARTWPYETEREAGDAWNILQKNKRKNKPVAPLTGVEHQ